jgi:hypothetical protein
MISAGIGGVRVPLGVIGSTASGGQVSARDGSTPKSSSSDAEARLAWNLGHARRDPAGTPAFWRDPSKRSARGACNASLTSEFSVAPLGRAPRALCPVEIVRVSRGAVTKLIATCRWEISRTGSPVQAVFSLPGDRRRTESQAIDPGVGSANRCDASRSGPLHRSRRSSSLRTRRAPSACRTDRTACASPRRPSHDAMRGQRNGGGPRPGQKRCMLECRSSGARRDLPRGAGSRSTCG